jgi:multiple sugar transport system substrate-binding protein
MAVTSESGIGDSAGDLTPKSALWCSISRRTWLRGAGLTMAGVLGAACGSSGGSEAQPAKSTAPVQIMYTDWEPTDGAQIQETVVADFQKKVPHITVDYQKNPGPYFEKLQTLLVAGTPPDSFALSQADLVQLTTQGSVADLDAYVKQDAKTVNAADFFKVHLEAWKVGGKQMALPRDGGGVVVFYNKSIFDTQGITPPAAGYTWDQWLEVCKRLVKKDGSTTTLYAATRNAPADWQHWTWQNGGELLDKDAKRSTLEAKEAVEAIQYHADLVQKQGVMPPGSFYGPGNEDALGQFMQGKAAMYFGLRSGMQRMRSITGFKMDAMPHPRQKNRLTPLNTTAVLLPKGGKKNDASWQLLQHMTSTEGQLKRMEQGGAVPSRDSVSKAPTYLSFMAPSMASDRINTIFPDMAREGSVRLRPQTPKWNELNALMNKEMEDVYAGKATAADVTKRLTPLIADLLK